MTAFHSIIPARHARWMLALVSVIAAIPASCPAAGENIQPATAALLETHCFACHGKDGKVKGDFDLRGLKTASDLLSRPELLQRMRDAVLDGEMPPPKAPQLPPPERDALLAGIGHLLETSLQTHSASPRTPVRRMNRLQYANAVNDLLGLKVELFVLPECILRDLSGYFQPETGRMPEQVEVGNRILGKGQLIAPRLEGVSPFPQDLRAANGYDNRADLLTLSPLLMESFLELSRSIFASSNLDARTCGKWRPYFEPPPTSVPVDAALEARLREFLTRAFRRTVDEGTLERYTAAARSHLQSGVDFTGAMKAAASAALASPRFLYLYDDATTGARPEKVDPFELAARLSFFLWSSIPDDELLALAACGRLSDPTVLAEQADRLMNDRRMKRFCDAFASQWLKIENLVACEPDMGRFSDFYQFGIVSHAKFGSVHMMLEPLLLFETVFVENRPVTDFIHSDFTYRSEQLAQFIRREKRFSPAKDGANWSETCVFSRQPVTSKREGGLITTSAVMTMTSNATTPKPISRGKWIVETLFNDPPPPPPGKVPDIAEAVTDKAKEKQMTLRQKFSLHSTEANCAACHAKIDPFGFALENYDAVGRWRDRDDNGHELDPSGKLFNRQEFKTIEQFKDALLSEKARFARGLAGHLLKYALGREVTSFDRPALDQIVATSAADGYRLRGMMRQVILSEPFSMKFNPPEDGASSQPSAPLKP